MKKEDFEKLGLDEDMAKRCETASADELRGFIPKSRFDEVNLAKKQANVSLKERDVQLASLEDAASQIESLKKSISKLQGEQESNHTKYESQLKQVKMDHAVGLAISGAKGKNATAIKALLDLSGAVLEEDGSIQGLTDQLTTLIDAEDSKFLFGGNGTMRGAVPSDGNGRTGHGNADTSTMTYSQLSSYMARNPDSVID